MRVVEKAEKSLVFRVFPQLSTLNSRRSHGASGFTLIELLTVIFIIGIISAVVSVNLSSARKQARDVRRKTDLAAIQSALELYANANGGKVPATTQPFTSTPWDSSFTNNLSLYLSSVPTDPLSPNANTAPYVYTYQTNASATSYAIDSVLEVESPQNANLPSAPPSIPSSPGFFVTGTYVVGTSPSQVVHYRVSSGE